LVDVLNKAYQDVCQTPKSTETKGFVDVRFIEKDGRKSQQSKAIIETMLRLQEAKIKPEDIMILVRNKSSISKISEAFEKFLSDNFDCKGVACNALTTNLNEDTKNYFKLVSDEAFRLSSSSAVCLIIDALRALSNYNDPLAFAQLAYTYQSQKNPNFDQNLIGFFNSYRANVETQCIASLPKKRPFQEFLPENFTRGFSALQKLPLYELIEKIIAIFELYEQKNQHAFLYDFLDCVNMFVAETGRDAQWCVSTTPHIVTFLEHWDDELHQKTITVNAQISGVRILTIHKSKGLEFHTVVVPFCEWEMDETRHEQLVWHERADIYDNIPVGADCIRPVNFSKGGVCNTPLQDNLFNRMPLIPLNYGKTLKQSHFSTDFENETLKLWVDNLNLLYVALTRPKHNLLVLAEALPKKSEKLRVSNLVHNFVSRDAQLCVSTGVFQKGNLIPSTEKHDDAFDGNVFKIPLKNFEVPFSIAQKQPTFYISDEARRWYKNMQGEINERNAVVETDNYPSLQKGLLYHKILAEIRHSNDVETTIEKFVFNGFISNNEKTTIAKHIHELLNNPKTQDWFSKKYRIFNECKIVNRGNNGYLEQRRPDRVMQDEHGNLILVDFKTGQKYPKHHEQIREYAVLLKEMFTNVETDNYPSLLQRPPEITGFLWYLDLNEIEEVEFH
jgi:ATP-dependent exoDNAse (exonuclease V) beta subunit